MNLVSKIERAKADRGVVGGLTAFVEGCRQQVAAMCAEISSQVAVGCSGPWKYLPNTPDAAGVDGLAEKMRQCINEQFRDIDLSFLAIIQDLEDIQRQIPDEGEIEDLDRSEEMDSYRSHRSAAE